MVARIPEARYYQLPATLQEKLRVYSGPVVQVVRGELVFTLADGRWAEIVRDMAAIQGGA